MENYYKSNIVCASTGDVIWIPVAHAKAYCAMDMTYWPNDKHKCQLEYGSWTHNGETLQLKHGNAVIEVSY